MPFFDPTAQRTPDQLRHEPGRLSLPQPSAEVIRIHEVPRSRNTSPQNLVRNTTSCRLSPLAAATIHSSITSSNFMPSQLLQELRNVIRRKHYSLRTEETYVGWTRDYIRYHRLRHPADMSEVEVVEYLTHLAVNRRVSASTQNQALNALVFLYKHVLRHPLGSLAGAARAKHEPRLPVVFTREEIVALMNRLDDTVWLVTALLYGAGLRLMEGLRLRVKDIAFDRLAIYVRGGKGGKDRVSMLPSDLVDPLNVHLSQVRLTFDRDLERGIAGVYLPFALPQVSERDARVAVAVGLPCRGVQ
jgi:integrase